MPRKTFVAGEVLAAADVNEFLADQVIMTFAGTAARGSAISVPVEGMVTYLEDDDQLEVYGGTAVGWSSASNFIFGTAVPTDGQVASYSTAVSGWVPADASSGKILQVVSTTKTDAFSTSSTSPVDITGLSVSITPSSTNSKILIFSQLAFSNGTANGGTGFQLVRNSTNIGVSTAATSRNATVSSQSIVAGSDVRFAHISFLDSPSTTSATTYKIQMRAAANTAYLNRRGDTSADDGSISTITVMEIAG